MILARRSSASAPSNPETILSSVGTLVQLHRYPVKSMLGERLDRIGVTITGLEGDRAHAFVDVATDKVASAKRPQLWREMLAFQAATEPMQAPKGEFVVRITGPDGDTMLTTDADVNDKISRALGRPVRLVAVRPEGIEIERSHPDVVSRDGVGSAATFDVLPLGMAAPTGGFFDYAPLHVMCTASLAKVAESVPDSRIEAPRYRPNIIIDNVDAEAFCENAWVGRELRVGRGLVLRVIAPTPRCAIPTLQHGGALPADHRALKAVAALNRAEFLDFGLQPCLGAYAEVVHPGDIRCGDAIELAP